MAISYAKLLKIFEERGITTYTIRQKKIVGQSTIKNIRNGGTIDTVTLNRLCEYLNCQPGDLLEYVPDEKK